MAKSRVSIKHNSAAYKDLLNSREVQDLVNKKAREIADIASEGGRVEGYVTTELVLEEPRSAASVMAMPGHAHYHNRKHFALLKAVYGAEEVNELEGGATDGIN